MSCMVVWFSKGTGEVCVSMQPDVARKLEVAITEDEAAGRAPDPALVRLRNEVRIALREAPSGI